MVKVNIQTMPTIYEQDGSYRVFFTFSQSNSWQRHVTVIPQAVSLAGICTACDGTTEVNEDNPGFCSDCDGTGITEFESEIVGEPYCSCRGWQGNRKCWHVYGKYDKDGNQIAEGAWEAVHGYPYQPTE